MIFDIWFRLGRDGARQHVKPLQILEGNILTVGSFAGSYHVHSMDRHYRDYIVNPNFPLLAAATALHPDFPVNFSYKPLLEKLPSPGISGNIGEALGGIMGTNVFGLGPRQIIHIVPVKGRIKAPDFIFHSDPVPTEARAFAQAHGVPAATLDNAAAWWPAEAKARKKGQGRAAFKEAFGQLISYWWELLEAGASIEDVGYGFIMVAEYNQAVPTLTVHFLVPRNPANVRRYFEKLRVARPNRKALGRFVRLFSAKTKGAKKLARTLRYFHGGA